jgi:Flp pilus assembly protein TadG
MPDLGPATRRRRSRADSGAAAAEFALILPILMMLVFAITALGLVLYNYEMLTGGVRAASRNFAISRGTTTPWSTTQSVLEQDSPGLDRTTLGRAMHLFVNGTECTTDALCAAAMVSGATGAVTATYPCTIQVLGVNAAPNCQLSQTSQAVIE